MYSAVASTRGPSVAITTTALIIAALLLAAAVPARSVAAVPVAVDPAEPTPRPASVDPRRAGRWVGVAHPGGEPRRVASVECMDHGNELGEFLRARRALAPPEVGHRAPDPVRRVPGLRREEVALLAGVSTDYYVRLEQGRERHPSRQVLIAIAHALHLDDEAIAHLLRIGFPDLHPASAPVTRVAAELQRLMDRMTGVTAFVVGPGQDVLAANALAEAVYRGFAAFDNLMRMIFLDPVARDFYLDWDQAARTAVRNLRATAPGAVERTEQVVGALSLRSPAFAALWAEHDVGPRTSEVKRFRHPDVGELTLHFESLTVVSAPGQHLSTYTADPGSPTAARLATLSSSTSPTTAADVTP